MKRPGLSAAGAPITASSSRESRWTKGLVGVTAIRSPIWSSVSIANVTRWSTERRPSLHATTIDAALDEVLTRPQPISLSAAELGAEAVKEAWVKFPESAVRVRGRTIAWTRRAVRVEWEMRDGATRRAWVWVSAVERVNG